MNIKEIWNNLFNKSEEKVEEEVDFEYLRPEDIDCSITSEILINDIKIINEYDENKPNLLIMDDFDAMVNLLLNELKRVPGDVYDNFNIYSASGEFAAFSVKKFLDTGGSFDLCFLDITLGGVIDTIELDGVDIAISIKERNPESSIRFITGHTLNKRNPEIFKFITKFNNHFDRDIDEKIDIIDMNGTHQSIYSHVIGKNDNRIVLMEYSIREYLSKYKK